ncbi:Protein of unknown function DUF506, plant [Cynara cardunculus var. scolymus]|uniref:Uncharacterized protein n=1 Tax=Cynara cardunculus var. scolymus TaxID=59895 RepID=A0A103Y864_CYNCS|nr:Protein of unknown function DUF506, plant [Cynara cardunculus var. scolymus]
MVQPLELRRTKMAGASPGAQVASRNSDDNKKGSGKFESTTEMIFEFLEESELSSGSSCNSGNSYDSGELEEEEENSCDSEENRSFWEAQEQLLTDHLFRTSSIESNIRKATKEIIKELKSAAVGCCDCGKTVADGCRRCFQREVSDRLRKLGEHTYIEVLDTSNSKKGVIRVIVELNFRAEFEMVKASQEYIRLISRLPEIYVGKTERLELLIKTLCSASKKCMKDRKMHIAPWRKLKYMQAKWHGVRESESLLSPEILSAVEHSSRLSRPMISLLTNTHNQTKL